MEHRRIPNRLKKFRRLAGLSQIEVAKVIGVQNSTCISRWEKGFGTPSLLYLFRLSCLYETFPHHIYAELMDAIQHDMESL